MSDSIADVQGPVLAVSLMGGANAAGTNRYLGGGDAEITGWLFSSLFVGFRAGAMADRRAVLFPLRANAGIHFFQKKLMVGAGWGTLLRFEEGREDYAPMVELMLRGRLPLFADLSGVLEANAAFALTEEHPATPRFNAGVRVGVAWDFLYR